MSKKKSEESLALIRHYQITFESKEGQKVLNDIISDCGILTATFDKDPLSLAFNEGKRSVALRLLKILNIDTAKLKTQIQEIEKERDIYEN